jgi:CBS domain containing-hemolysin-like protein
LGRAGDELTVDPADLLLSAGVVGAVIVSAGLAMAATVLREASRARAMAMEAEGRRGARRLVALLDKPGRAIAAVHLLWWITLVGSGGLAAMLGDRHGHGWGAALAVAVAVAMQYVLGAVVPSTLAERSLDAVALRLAGPVHALVRFPPVRVVSRVLVLAAAAVLGRRGVRGGAFDQGEGGDAEQARDHAAEHDAEVAEERLLHSVTEFGDTVVHEAMVPRTDMDALPVECSVSEALDRVVEAGYSRMPCSEGTLDHIAGIVHLKDLVVAVRAGRGDDPVRSVLRPAFFVPETKRVAELLGEMRTRKQHMAVAVDEHGGIAGLITLEDVLEELVGEIADEHDDHETLIEAVADGRWSIAGRATIAEVNEALGLDLPDDEWDTVGGFVLHLAGEVPRVGDSEGYEKLRFQVDRMQGRRIERIVLTRLEPAVETADRG